MKVWFARVRKLPPFKRPAKLSAGTKSFPANQVEQGSEISQLDVHVVFEASLHCKLSKIQSPCLCCRTMLKAPSHA